MSPDVGSSLGFRVTLSQRRVSDTLAFESRLCDENRSVREIKLVRPLVAPASRPGWLSFSPRATLSQRRVSDTLAFESRLCDESLSRGSGVERSRIPGLRYVLQTARVRAEPFSRCPERQGSHPSRLSLLLVGYVQATGLEDPREQRGVVALSPRCCVCVGEPGARCFGESQVHAGGRTRRGDELRVLVRERDWEAGRVLVGLDRLAAPLSLRGQG